MERSKPLREEILRGGGAEIDGTGQRVGRRWREEVKLRCSESDRARV